jgi:tetratricopeptide (TPR) repeat protein
VARCEALRADWPPQPPEFISAPDPATTEAEAREIGIRYSATMVIWGLYDDASVALAVDLLGSGLDAAESSEAWPTPGLDTCRLPLARAGGDLASTAAYLAALSLGLLQIQQGQMTQAHKLFDLALAVASAGPMGGMAVTSACYWRSTVNWLSGEAAAALTDLDRAIDLRPGWPCAEAQRGVVLLGLGQPRMAQVAFTAAIAGLGPGQQRAQAALLGNLGLARLAQGDRQEALSHFHEALALEESWGSLGGQARQLLRIGEIIRPGHAERAAQIFTRAAQLFQSVGAERGLAYALAGRAQALAQEGQIETARAGYNEALVILERLGARAEVAAVRGQMRALR